MKKEPYNEIEAILFRESRPDLVNYLRTLRDNLICTETSPKKEQLNKAIELLEACSEDLFISGDDVELETRVDEFIKTVKS